jgi:broad specificity phosphatase PhoE
MRLFCLRHGRTNYNDLGLCNGDPSKPVHLTNEGLRQAEAAASTLRGTPLACLFVSELPRTRETADIINRHHCVPIVVAPALNDIRSGCEGRPVTEYQAAIADDPVHARVGDGESLHAYRRRVDGFLDWLLDRPHAAVGLVVHEETMRVIHGRFMGLDDGALPALRFANCAVHEYTAREPRGAA